MFTCQWRSDRTTFSQWLTPRFVQMCIFGDYDHPRSVRASNLRACMWFVLERSVVFSVCSCSPVRSSESVPSLQEQSGSCCWHYYSEPVWGWVSVFFCLFVVYRVMLWFGAKKRNMLRLCYLFTSECVTVRARTPFLCNATHAVI